jgi:hypothetical protein
MTEGQKYPTSPLTVQRSYKDEGGSYAASAVIVSVSLSTTTAVSK